MMYICICAFKHSVSHELVLNSTQLKLCFPTKVLKSIAMLSRKRLKFCFEELLCFPVLNKKIVFKNY